MKKSIKNTGIVIIILISLIFAIYGIFYLNTIIKKANYSINYEKMVKKTIREMVREEALKDKE